MKVIFTTFDKKKTFSDDNKKERNFNMEPKDSLIVSHFLPSRKIIFLCYCVIIVVIFPAFRPTFDFD